MNLPHFKKNQSGFAFFSALPENFRLATIDVKLI